MNKIAYLTLVTLVCYVDGKRTEIPPGKPVPEDLSETDIEALLASGSIERSDAGEIEKRQQQLAGSRTQGEFVKERERILAERQANKDASASAAAAAAGGSGSGSGKTDSGEGGAGGNSGSQTGTGEGGTGGNSTSTSTKGGGKK